jgi:hypothetical protein
MDVLESGRRVCGVAVTCNPVGMSDTIVVRELTAWAGFPLTDKTFSHPSSVIAAN